MRRLILWTGLVLLGAPGIDMAFHHAWWASAAVVVLAWALTWLILPPARRQP
jgi:hypothetical protein